MEIEDYTSMMKGNIFQMGSSNAKDSFNILIDDLKVEDFLVTDPYCYLRGDAILKGNSIARVSSYISGGSNSIKFECFQNDFRNYSFWLTETKQNLKARVGIQKIKTGSLYLTVIISSRHANFKVSIEEFIFDLQSYVKAN